MRCILDTLGGFALFLSLLATTPTPSNADPAGTKWIGCYVDSESRVLSVWANGVNNYVTSMTNEMCASECSGYNYFGTEAGPLSLSVFLATKLTTWRLLLLLWKSTHCRCGLSTYLDYLQYSMRWE
jgi:hypothetical protein